MLETVQIHAHHGNLPSTLNKLKQVALLQLKDQTIGKSMFKLVMVEILPLNFHISLLVNTFFCHFINNCVIVKNINVCVA